MTIVLNICIYIFSFINFIKIGDVNNPPSENGYGKVTYEYSISETELTNECYCFFLNSVAKTYDPYNLYNPIMGEYFWGGIVRKTDSNGNFVYYVKPGFEKYPAIGITWNSAIRFINWLNYNWENIKNKKDITYYISETEGDDNHGAYNTQKYLNSSLHIKRNKGARFYLPNKNEWIKACFYNGKEYITTNQNLQIANCYTEDGWKYPYPHLLSSEKGTVSHYGTINQNGNLGEWIEDPFGTDGRNWKQFLGGSLIRPKYSLDINYTEGDAPDKSIASVGIRIIQLTASTTKQTPPTISYTPKHNTRLSQQQDEKWIKIGDIQNEGDLYNQFIGNVNYEYEISKYELTNEEYAQFLSAVCRYEDPYHLYNKNMEIGAIGGINKIKQNNGEYKYQAKQGWERKPVVYISFYDLCRYANWMHYGCPNTGKCTIGTTEGTATQGAYDTGKFGTKSKKSIRRNKGAKYFIPNRNEWYKAAYYDPTIQSKNKYHIYPTQSSTPPSFQEANYMIDNQLCIGSPFYVCNVDSFQNAPSHYGTLQQGGNVWEWIEDWQFNKYGHIALRGGSFSYTEYGLSSINEDPGGINDISYVFGGRLARISQDTGYIYIPMNGKNYYYYIISQFYQSPKKSLLILCCILIILSLIIFTIMLKFKSVIKNIIYTLQYLTNIIIWIFLKKKKALLPTNESRILYIPCDPWSVWGSRGDEAMIYASMKLLKEKHKTEQFYFITSTDKGITETQNRGYKAIKAWKGKSPIYHISQALRELNPTQVIIIGADCMDGYYSPDVSFTLMATADLCSSYNIPYHILGFSFNENPSWKVKLAYLFCSSAVRFNLRDYFSQQRFEHFTHKKSTLVADMAFLLEPNPNFYDFKEYQQWCQQEKNKQQTIVGFNFHPMLKKNQSIEEIHEACSSLADMIIHLLNQHSELSFLFIPHDNRGKLSDTIVLPIIANKIREKGYAQRIKEIKEVYHADEIKAIASLCDIMICSRMHLAIGSLSSGVPVMAATYQGKFHGLFKHYGLPEDLLLSPATFITKEFISTFERLLKEKKSLAKTLQEKQPEINILSAKNIEE